MPCKLPLSYFFVFFFLVLISDFFTSLRHNCSYIELEGAQNLSLPQEVPLQNLQVQEIFFF